MLTGWIPAFRQAQGKLFAGMTATSGAHISQMIPVAAGFGGVLDVCWWVKTIPWPPAPTPCQVTLAPDT